MSAIKTTKTEKKQSIKDVLRQRKKEQKKKLKEKRARLVVKNLPFNTTEENLREHFVKFGDVSDIHILKKEDGKLTGCAFIQFKLVQKARKAKHYTHGQTFLGRKLEVDFAMSKKEYEILRYKKKVKEEIEVKSEPVDDQDEKDIEKIQVAEKSDILEDRSDIHEDRSDSDEDRSDSDEEKDESENDHMSEDELNYDEEGTHESKPRVVSNDISEGKTVFIKNIPFEATNADLEKCMNQYGPIHYALICVDKYTEHSKGTGFVKFCFKEDAEKVLQAGTELKLLGNILDCHKALCKNEIHSQQNNKLNKKKDTKDSRNLYLVKEGVILAGSQSAEGVSQADMLKRLQLEKYKSQMLRNLNMFVSRERLVVHNLPLTWDDKKFRELCKKFAGDNARIKEARVMRNMRDLDTDGVGKSKGFGFVTLDSHQSALTLLRNLNNNPNIFSAAKRPIVTFSIERKTAINAKLKRLERSRQKNPVSKQYDPKLVEQERKRKEENAKNVPKLNTNENLKNFAGIPGKPGVQRMRNNFKLSQQAAKHYESVKNEKKKKKMAKKTLKEKKKDFTKEAKQKIRNKEESDEFSKMISSYKKTISNAPSLKTKWYS
ncbi:RNA-binding protein 28 isoform X2 [Coccinella septempunctata]|uniref:RNA-binding protein 28 isoform X2 n=1 Tax=Coccinella septempunctata TaxID=41139 RepID=UPI001D0965DA|nr:RNA-binding protein 28 isoform X2 [Coccinella septempunctata]